MRWLGILVFGFACAIVLTTATAATLDTDTVEKAAGWTVAALGGIAAAARWWWRRFSRDRTEVVKDREERRLIEVLSKERDTANERADRLVLTANARVDAAVDARDRAIAAHLEIVAKVAGLETRIVALTEELHIVRGMLYDALGHRKPMGG